MVMVSARERLGDEWGMRAPFVQSDKLRRRSVRVRLFSSGVVVRRYSQDLIAKKNAPVHS